MKIENYLKTYSEEQIQGFYSSFPDISDQPDLYQTRIQRWNTLILEMISNEPDIFSKNENYLAFDFQSFKQAVTYKGSVPLSLPDIYVEFTILLNPILHRDDGYSIFTFPTIEISN